MKKVVLIFYFLMLSSSNICLGQEQFSILQFYQTQPMLNPGFTGIESFLDIKLGYRVKWKGLESSPVTTFLSGFKAIGDKTSYNQSPLRISNPNQIEYIQTQKDRMKYHGVGGYIRKHSQGAYEQTTLMLNYAYHIPLNSKIKLALGTSFGFSNAQINIDKISVWDKTNDIVYQSYINGNTSYWNFSVNLGGVIYGKKSYLGFSFQPVFDIYLSNTNDYVNPNKKLITMAGTKFNINSFLTLQPSMLFEVAKTGTAKLVGSMLLNMKNIVKTGLNFSNDRDIAFSASFNYKNELSISYAYERSLGNVSRIENGTHEIILSVNLFNHLNATHRLW